jgi:integrase
MALVTRIRKTGPVYFVANKQNGVPVWERVGSDKREAQRRDAAMKKEIASGVYLGKPTGAKTVGAYATTWLAARTNISADDDRSRWTVHVVGRCPWFLDLKLEDVRTQHVLRLIAELKQPYTDRLGKPRVLAPRSLSNIFATTLRPMFRDARIHDLMIRNVCELPKGTLSRSSKRRKPYDASTVVTMTTDPRVDLDWRVFFTLLFYTGVRKGEACGLRFRDYDPEVPTLGALVVEKQYEGVRLKTEDQIGDNTRWIPVHPFLAAALAEWWKTGFELVHCRKPTLDDFICPRRVDSKRAHSESSAYEGFRAALRRVGIENQTLHATRNTFISLCRRAGAREDVLERVTHNARGSVIDVYTDFDWSPLCEAVSLFMTQASQPDRSRAAAARRHLRAV